MLQMLLKLSTKKITEKVISHFLAGCSARLFLKSIFYILPSF